MKRILITLTLASLALTVRGADFAAQVNDLIPKLAAADVGSRYEAQMQLQVIASASSMPGNDADRAALGAVLAAKAAAASVPQPARVWIIRQLEYMGRGEVVTALGALLGDADAELRECARRALEKNPDPKAIKVLRAALQKGGDTTWKIGLIRSLGEKHDAGSVAMLVPLLNDPKLGRPAAKALGSIASPEAIDALWKAVDTQSFACESLVDAVNFLLSAGKRDGAVTAADKLYKSRLPSPVRAAGLALMAKSDAEVTKQYIEPSLRSGDTRLEKAAVDAALVIYGKTASATLAALLPKLPDSAKVFVLNALTPDPSAEKAALGCATEKGESVRIAALEVLAKIGTAASVTVLIKAAVNGSETEKNAAAASLGRINGALAGEAIAQQARQGDAAVRAVAIASLAGRADKSAVPSLLSCAAENDASVSKAALVAIGKIGNDESLDSLVRLVLDGKPGAKDALLAVANRSANKSVIGQQLAAQAQRASSQQLAGILDVMSLVGGTDALAAVVKFTADGNDEVKDGAIRALCQWREFAAVKPLLDVAATTGVKLTHQVLAIQGVCRLVRNGASEPSMARVDAALAALKTAGRDQEKKQVLSALASIKDRKAADAIIKLLTDTAVKTDAAQAALLLADALRKPDRGTSKKLAEAVKKANISPELDNRAEQLLRKK